MYNEPDWSLLTQAELLEKAQEFGKKAYSSSLSTHSFLMLAMEAGERYSTATIEIAELSALRFPDHQATGQEDVAGVSGHSVAQTVSERVTSVEGRHSTLWNIPPISSCWLSCGGCAIR